MTNITNFTTTEKPNYDWQKEAFEKWVVKGRGTIKASTGTGKTRLGMMAIRKYRDKRILVVVPTIHLQHQWAQKMQEVLGIDTNEIGFVGGGNKDFQMPIVIAVVNSLRDLELNFELIILDECHRVPTERNWTFMENSKFPYILSLSATPEREDKQHTLLMKLAPVVYTYDQQQGIKDNILKKYDIVNVGVYLTPIEETAYFKLQDFIDLEFPNYNKNFNEVVDAVQNRKDWKAGRLLRAFSRRRTLLLNADNKVKKVKDIIMMKRNNGMPKTFVFCEYIKTAEKLKKLLHLNGVEAAIYHSGLKMDMRKQMLDDFREDKFKIMIAVKALDEGIDVPNAEFAIILAGSKVKRQAIQRVGRILRRHGGKSAKLIQIYVRDTQDYYWTKTRLSGLSGYSSVRWI